MKLNNTLAAEISHDLHIIQDNGEPAEYWKRRIAYSLIGCQMLASLYDYDDAASSSTDVADSTVSMQHVLNRGVNLSQALDFADVDCEKIRAIYMQTGNMLHKNNRLTYPQKRAAVDEDIIFVRGAAPWEGVRVSGIGMYTINSDYIGLSAEQLFGIETHDIVTWFTLFEKSLKWEDLYELPQNVEYLNILDNVKSGYWQSRPPKKGITLCRSKDHGEREYAMLQITDKIERSVLQKFRVDNGEYFRIALALRIANGRAPILTVKHRAYTTIMETDYLLPSAEQSFFELYSWSATEQYSLWKRIIASTIYPTLKRIFERLGYKILEVL